MENIQIRLVVRIFIIFQSIAFILLANSPLLAQSSSPAQLKKGDVEITGVVIRNVKKCRVDGPCFLDVKSDIGIVRVSYAAIRGSNCINKKAFDVAFEIEADQRIRVRGYSNGGGISMCRNGESENYTIEKLN